MVDVKDRVVKYPNRYRIINIEENVVDLIREQGVIFEEGTPVNKELFDNIQNDAQNNLDDAKTTLDASIDAVVRGLKLISTIEVKSTSTITVPENTKYIIQVLVGGGAYADNGGMTGGKAGSKIAYSNTGASETREGFSNVKKIKVVLGSGGTYSSYRGGATTSDITFTNERPFIDRDRNQASVNYIGSYYNSRGFFKETYSDEDRNRADANTGSSGNKYANNSYGGSGVAFFWFYGEDR